MSASVLTLFTETTLDGFPLWVVLLICGGVFLAGFMDAIAGGGGIISVPVYLMALLRPAHPLCFRAPISSPPASAPRFPPPASSTRGYVHWRLFLPAAGLAVAGSVCGTQLQLHTPDVVLKYLLLAVLPVVAFFTLRTKMWPEEPAPIPPRRQAAIVWAAALLIGTYDGYYGPGTGTFLMLVFIHLGKMDTRHAAGGVKVINLASNIGGVCSALMAGTVVLGVGLAAALASILGHYLGAGLAIRNGSKIVRPAVVVVLLLLLVKVISELLFPNFWN